MRFTVIGDGDPVAIEAEDQEEAAEQSGLRGPVTVVDEGGLRTKFFVDEGGVAWLPLP